MQVSRLRVLKQMLARLCRRRVSGGLFRFRPTQPFPGPLVRAYMFVSGP